MVFNSTIRFYLSTFWRNCSWFLLSFKAQAQMAYAAFTFRFICVHILIPNWLKMGDWFFTCCFIWIAFIFLKEKVQLSCLSFFIFPKVPCQRFQQNDVEILVCWRKEQNSLCQLSDYGQRHRYWRSRVQGCTTWGGGRKNLILAIFKEPDAMCYVNWHL